MERHAYMYTYLHTIGGQCARLITGQHVHTCQVFQSGQPGAYHPVLRRLCRAQGKSSGADDLDGQWDGGYQEDL